MLSEWKITEYLRSTFMSLGIRLTSRPQLRYKDVCNRDLKALQIKSQTRKNTASANKHLRQTVNQEFKQFDVSLAEKTDQMRQHRKEKGTARGRHQLYLHTLCERDCYFRVGLCSHWRRCRNHLNQSTNPKSPETDRCSLPLLLLLLRLLLSYYYY